MKKILVGVDTSDRAADVVREAVELARDSGAKLYIVRAANIPVEFPIEALSVDPDALPARLVSVTQRGLDHFTQQIPKELVERSEARLGTPWQVICDSAKEFGVDLVVIGTHGYGALDRLIGTTAARVVNHAPCSVLVVRKGGSA